MEEGGGIIWNHSPVFFLQILVDTAQKRQALNEVEARHMEIIQLEANIRVSPIPSLHSLSLIPIPSSVCVWINVFPLLYYRNCMICS